jgi:hypothetical protein
MVKQGECVGVVVYLLVTMESISSRKITQGRACLARRNTLRIVASASPIQTYAQRDIQIDIQIKGHTRTAKKKR